MNLGGADVCRSTEAHDASAEVPLNVLLSHALLDLTRTCEQAGAREVVLWSNLLRAIGDDGIDLNALPPLVRLSKRAVKTTVDGVARHGWARVDGGVVRLTDQARRARDEWGAAVARAESTWPAASSLRAPLEAFVSRLGLEHSHYPCGYGAADWRITGGPGVDWKAVPRDPTADTVGPLSVLALLSQALVGFAVEYESRVPFAIVVGVHLDAVFADGPVSLDDAPPVLMITGNGRSSLERHGAVEVDRSRQVTLTSVGRRVRDAYRPTVAAVESSLEATTPLRAVLEGVDVHGLGHADHPDVRFVGGTVGFAEVSARAQRRCNPAVCDALPGRPVRVLRTTAWWHHELGALPRVATGDPWSAGVVRTS